MSEREIRPCYREANGVHFTKNAHRHDCDEAGCRGCVVCKERHCTARTNCTWHVTTGELTCGRCITGVRVDLRWIEALAGLLPAAAEGDGVDSEAANLAGPAADPVDWSERRVAQKRHLWTWETLGRITEAQHLHALTMLDDEDKHHPATVLGTWARMVAEDYGHDMPRAASVSWCADYLDRTLHRIAHDEEQDFPLLRRELRKCRQHLEAVLHNDDRPDRGAPCPTCARETGKAPLLQREYAHWCDDEACERFHLTDDGSDVWRCPKDRGHWWTAQGYAEVVRDLHEETSATA